VRNTVIVNVFFPRRSSVAFCDQSLQTQSFFLDRQETFLHIVAFSFQVYKCVLATKYRLGISLWLFASLFLVYRAERETKLPRCIVSKKQTNKKKNGNNKKPKNPHKVVFKISFPPSTGIGYLVNLSSVVT